VKILPFSLFFSLSSFLCFFVPRTYLKYDQISPLLFISSFSSSLCAFITKRRREVKAKKLITQMLKENQKQNKMVKMLASSENDV